MKIKKIISLLTASALALSYLTSAAPASAENSAEDKIICSDDLRFNPISGDFIRYTIGESSDPAGALTLEDFNNYDFVEIDYTISDEAINFFRTGSSTGTSDDPDWVADTSNYWRETLLFNIFATADGFNCYHSNMGDIHTDSNERSFKICTNSVFTSLNNSLEYYGHERNAEETMSSFTINCAWPELLRDYTDAVVVNSITLTNDKTGAWYEENGKFTFTNNTGTDLTQIPTLRFNLNNIDSSKVKYFAADITVSSGTSYGAFNYTNSDGSYIPGKSTAFTSKKTALKMEVSGTDMLGSEFGIWNLAAGATITVENVYFSYEPSDTIGSWVEIEDGTYYYNHGNLEENEWVDPRFDLELPEGIKWSDVQAISMDVRADKGALVNLKGTKADGSTFIRGIPFNTSGTLKSVTITRNIRGVIESDAHIECAYFTPGQTAYISNIRFITDPVPEIVVEPNDILIDESETAVDNWNLTIQILPDALTPINTTGTLKLYMEDNVTTYTGWEAPYYLIAFNDSKYSGTETDSWFVYVESTPLVGNIVEIKIDEALIEKFKTSSINILGAFFKYTKAVFTPDPDTPVPETETIVPDKNEKEKLDKEFKENKQHIKPEREGPKKNSDMEHNKLYVQKSGTKQHNGKDVYALRFVQKVKLNDIKGVKDIGMVMCVDGKYIELSTKNYFKKVNINGQEIIAGEDEVFIILILDDIPTDKEISFSHFKFNKK